MSGLSSSLLTTITGAGPAGSAAAYFLHKLAEQDGFEVNITVFEKTDRIGGRTLTVNAFDNPLEPVELGASIFVKENHILYNATRDFDLAVKEPETSSGEVLGIWNGEEFLYTQSDNSWGWWNLAKLFWKYGMAPYKAQKLVKSTVATFLQLYEAPNFPFKSLTERALELGLLDFTTIAGKEFLAKHDVSLSCRLFLAILVFVADRSRYPKLSRTTSFRPPLELIMRPTWLTSTALRPW